MEFKIHRTSEFDRNVQPHPRAYRKCVPLPSDRVYDSKYDWYITVDSLEELLALARECDLVILDRGDSATIELYDDYRE